MKAPTAALLALLIVPTAVLAGQSTSKKSKAAEDPAPNAPSDDGKKRVENYLAERTKKLQDAYAARLQFSTHETLMWEEFWGKDREARKTFELRIARQMVDLFSTLETLDPKDHDSTIADFEKLRGTMVRSFEAQQKQKMQDFFAARESRWKQFTDSQEKDRAAFAADAEAVWQDDKNYLKSLYGVTLPPPGAASGAAK